MAKAVVGRSWVWCECEAGKKTVKVPAKGKAAKGKGAKGKEAAAEPVPEKPAVWGQVANAVVYGVPSTLKRCVVRLWWGESAVCSLESVVKNRMDIRKNGI